MNPNTEQIVAKKKSIKIWVSLIVAPILALVTVALLQVSVSFTLNKPSSCYTGNTGSSTALFDEDISCEHSSRNTTKVIINIIEIVIGLFAVIALMLEPLWIIMLVVTVNHNNKLHLPEA